MSFIVASVPMGNELADYTVRSEGDKIRIQLDKIVKFLGGSNPDYVDYQVIVEYEYKQMM